MRTFLVLLFLVIAGLVGWNYYSSAHPQEVKFLTAIPVVGDIVEAVPVTGYAEPIEVRNVQAEVLGTVEEVLVDYNTEVKQGQVLARLSSDIPRVQLLESETKLLAAEASVPRAEAAFEAAKSGQAGAEAALAAAEAGLTASQAMLDAATREFKTAKKIAEDNLGPKSKADTAEDLMKKAEAQVQESKSKITQAMSGKKQTDSLLRAAEAGKLEAKSHIQAAKVAVQLGQLNLAKTELRSNMNGIILNRDVRVGDTVGRPRMSLTESSPAIFEIAAPLNKMRAIVKVSEADYSRVKVGQSATFTIDAYPKVKFVAKVAKVRYAPTSDRTAVSYATELQFENQRDPDSGDWMVKPRSTISADIEIRQAKGVKTIPNAAILFSPTSFGEEIPPVKDDERLVWTIGSDGKPSHRKIVVGISDGIITEVLGGNLADGEKVIIGQPPTQSGSLIPRLPISS